MPDAPACWNLKFDEAGLAWLTMDKPNTGANVLSQGVLAELDQRLAEVEARSPRGLVVTSAKKSGFIAGADIKEFTGMRTPAEAAGAMRTGHRVFDRLEALPCPSVAVIQGFALGGGLELALACTYRVGVDDGKLSLGFPEVQLGIHPGFGGTVRSVRLVGVRPAMDMMLTGKPVKADHALAIGLIDRLSTPAEALDAARALLRDKPARGSAPFVEKLLNLGFVRPFIARQIEATVQRKARRDHYPAPYAMIDLWRRHGASGQASMDAEVRSLGELMVSPTARNLVRVFLLQDRLKGLGGKPSFECRALHVVGAGVMGGDIAAWGALRGLNVTLQDRSEELIRPAMERARALFEKRLKEPAAVGAALARLKPDVAGAGVREADVVIEAIFENADAKRSLYAQLEPQMKPGALLATNTSSIMTETLAEKLTDPSRLAGVHFFNPVAQMQLIEVVRGSGTRPEVEAAALAFVRKLDKLPLPCRSAPGFVVNRILMPYINEALAALESGIPAQVIDRCSVDFGMPMGPIELADVVGLDVCLSVGRVLAQAFGRTAPAVLEQKVAAKELGRKTGQGFYRWENGKPVRPDTPAAAPPEDLQDRLILTMLNEAVAILREKVAQDHDLLDAGVIFATGFAPFRGGPLQYAKDRGIAAVRHRLTELQQRYGDRFRPDEGWDALAE
ncbi:MAG: 3-hydroxyacyl-CoA dehydrogenase NAD-binding domain-containing protein [Steroidobacteraceae bacterium]